MTSDWPWTFNGQKYLYTLNPYPRGLDFCLFRSTTSRCRDLRWQIGNHWMTLKVQILVWLLPTICEEHGCQKLQMHDWHQGALEHYRSKVPLYTKYLTLRPKVWSFSLHEQTFSRYRTFYNSPVITTVKTLKTEQNCRNLNIWNLILSILTILVETLPRSIDESWGINLLCTFRGGVVWNVYTFTPVWTNGKKKSNIWNFTTVKKLPRSILHEFWGVKVITGHV